jgi:hypothetical protein
MSIYAQDFVKKLSTFRQANLNCRTDRSETELSFSKAQKKRAAETRSSLSLFVDWIGYSIALSFL